MSGLPIQIGYAWRQEIRMDTTQGAVIFPDGATWTAHVKANTAQVDAIGVATVTRLSDIAVQLEIPEAVSALLTPGHVVMDIVRTDTDPDEHTYITLRIQVVQPVTRAA